jgi:mannose-6-phosphate isomerase-like protein (cupin superfamily)
VQTPIAIDFDAIPWQLHPTISGIYVKAFPNNASFAPTDVLIARVDTDGEIPWHVHETDTEIAYMFQGRGTLYSAPGENREQVAETAMIAGQSLLIPPGLWHSVRNIGDSDIIVLAIHTPG